MKEPRSHLRGQTAEPNRGGTAAGLFSSLLFSRTHRLVHSARPVRPTDQPRRLSPPTWQGPTSLLISSLPSSEQRWQLSSRLLRLRLGHFSRLETREEGERAEEGSSLGRRAEEKPAQVRQGKKIDLRGGTRRSWEPPRSAISRGTVPSSRNTPRFPSQTSVVPKLLPITMCVKPFFH